MPPRPATRRSSGNGRRARTHSPFRCLASGGPLRVAYRAICVPLIGDTGMRCMRATTAKHFSMNAVLFKWDARAGKSRSRDDVLGGMSSRAPARHHRRAELNPVANPVPRAWGREPALERGEASRGSRRGLHARLRASCAPPCSSRPEGHFAAACSLRFAMHRSLQPARYCTGAGSVVAGSMPKTLRRRHSVVVEICRTSAARLRLHPTRSSVARM